MDPLIAKILLSALGRQALESDFDDEVVGH
jgi:hypothetical protein